jgi:hypothetical protein
MQMECNKDNAEDPLKHFVVIIGIIIYNST